MEKTATFYMTNGEWGVMYASLEKKYAIVPSGDKHLTISSKLNDGGRCGEVNFLEEGLNPVRVKATSLDLEKDIASFSHLKTGNSVNRILQNLVSGKDWGIRKYHRLGIK